MSLERCIRDIIDETQTTLTKEEVADIMDMLIQYDLHPRNRQTFGPFSPEQGRVQTALENATAGRLMQARDILIARARLVAAQQAANVIANAAKRAERFTTYADAGDPVLGIQAKLIGTNTPFLGSRDSAAAAIEGNLHDLVGSFDQELKAAGLDRVFASGEMRELWARELHELNRRNGTPGVTGSPQALRLARIIHNLQRRGVDMVNREGAYVGSYDGYIARTSHSSHRLVTMGENAWVALANQYFDIDLIYPNRDPAFIDDALRQQYRRIASGLHDSYSPEELDLVPHVAGQNLARKVSERRVIHFRDAQSWLRYMEAAGEVTPEQAIFRSAQSMARDAGLMRIWGTNPKAALEADFLTQKQLARDAGNFQLVERLNRSNRDNNLWMSYLNGEANHVTNETWARVTQNVLAVQRTAKLGFLPFAQLTDLASIAGELRYQGVGFVDRITGGIFQGYFRGGMNSEKRQVADLLNAYLEGELSQYGMLLETNDPMLSGTFTGRLNRIQQWFFTYTGATALTNRARGSLMYMMSRHWGSMHGMSYTQLGASEQRMMRVFGIDEPEWDALAQANWLTGNQGNLYLTPRDAMNIPDAAIDQYNLTTGRAMEYGEFRQEMSRRLYSLYADRMNYGVLNPGVAERALLYQGGEPGSALGVALRLITQFKTFMVAQLRRTWGREIYGGQGALGAVSGIVQFAVAGTILGTAANAMNQLFKGQDPFSQWEKEPHSALAAGFLRAGSASVIGDYLFGEMGRHGNTISAYALGPTIGSVETVTRAFYKMKQGDNPAGDLVKFAQGVTPFTNMFYTKMLTDYLIWNGLVDAANPDYLRNAERRLKRDQGIEYFPGMAPKDWRAW